MGIALLASKGPAPLEHERAVPMCPQQVAAQGQAGSSDGSEAALATAGIVVR